MAHHTDCCEQTLKSVGLAGRKDTMLDIREAFDMICGPLLMIQTD